MSVLSVEASGKFLSLAFERSGSISTRRLRLDNNLCETLIREIDSISQGSVSDLDEILVGDGPGSFTSLRIVFSTVKGLSLALGVPVRRLSVLALLALSASCGSGRAACEKLERPIVVPVSDARKGRLYYAAYSKDGHQLIAPGDKRFQDIKQEIMLTLASKAGESACFDGVLFVSDDDSLALDVSDMGSEFTVGTFLSHANLAEILLENRCMTNVLERFQGPTYVRLSDAEENLIRKNSDMKS